ncbi:hypothetical protein BC936DRAFT_142037 [Jimgerdemannia flammicorona]|uniref:RRM domain-containing protein n=1 Tax=Jimgerdemannia flammicorona TaxID=994334 RepID=A0A433A1A0_9FUNG|nr:hypothetical protein BC936DRAFT_142037 [Jimgerdemannia flammicorona]
MTEPQTQEPEPQQAAPTVKTEAVMTEPQTQEPEPQQAAPTVKTEAVMTKPQTQEPEPQQAAPTVKTEIQENGAVVDRMEVEADAKKRKREEEEEVNAPTEAPDPPSHPTADPIEPSPLVQPAKKLRRFNSANNNNNDNSGNIANDTSATTPGHRKSKTEVREEEEVMTISTESLKEIMPTETPATTTATSTSTPAPIANSGPVSPGDQKAEVKDESAVVDDQAKLDDGDSVPTATHDPTNSIYIKNFVRPLTLGQVKRLVELHGEVERLWIDSIKTHCYVTYTTAAAAETARSAIHNIKFPPDTGRQLHVDFLSSELAGQMISEEERAQQERRKIDWEAMLAKGGPSGIQNVGQKEEEIDFANVPTEPAAMRERGRVGGSPLGLVQKQLQKAAAAVPVPAALNAASTSTAPPSNVKVLSLEELFSKTEARPVLYYLPVPEEVAKQRRERMRVDRDRLRDRQGKIGPR